ncbi:thioesterase superfamily protein [Mycobacterium kansasii]|uniref:Thioesterase superfamily protein n=1 Tax=Mycobacterium kansasii TaxID=1768 RepID=A0A1V3WRT5_MYCKA|nr:thioesterase superfamily protein [Mycobacterium kansasii]
MFTTAMALRQVDAAADEAVFHGELNRHWTIGPKVHGGAMMALCANAARMAYGGAAAQPALQPVVVSANFLWAPDPGAMRLVTSIRKRGRRIGVVDVELTQGERTAVHAVVTLGEPEHQGCGGGPAAVGEPGRGSDGTRTSRRCRADRTGPPAGRTGAPGRGLRRAAAAVDAAARYRRAAAGHPDVGAPARGGS